MRTWEEILEDLKGRMPSLLKDDEAHVYARALIVMFGEWLGLEEGMSYADAEARCRDLVEDQQILRALGRE